MAEALTMKSLGFIPPRLAPGMLKQFLSKHWGIEGEFKQLSGERDQNFQVTTSNGKRYVLKIAGSLEDPASVDCQVQALLHLQAVDSGLSVPRLLSSHSGKFVETLIHKDHSHAVRLLSYVEGVPIGDKSPLALETIQKTGALQGRICRAFEGFEHIAASQFMPWDIMNGLVTSEEFRNECLKDGFSEQCAPWLDRYEFEVLPKLYRLPHQVIHNDAHSGNVLCNPDDPALITGVIDFGDLISRPIIVDLSTSLTSVLEHSRDLLQSSAALVSGFREYLDIPEEQLEFLFDAVIARAIMTVGLLEFRVDNNDVNLRLRDVDLPASKSGLHRILNIDPEQFYQHVSHQFDFEHIPVQNS